MWPTVLAVVGSLIVPLTIRWGAPRAGSANEWIIDSVSLEMRDVGAQRRALGRYARGAMLEHRCNAQWILHELGDEADPTALETIPVVRRHVRFAPLTTMAALACTSAAGAAVVDPDLAREIVRYTNVPSFVSYALRRVLFESRRRRLRLFGRMSPTVDAVADCEPLRLHAGDGSYWDNCALVGALREARAGEHVAVYMFGGSMPAWRDYTRPDTPSIIACPRLFDEANCTMRTIRREGPCYHAAVSDLVTLSTEYDVEAGVRVTLHVLGNELIDDLDVMPVSQQIYSPNLDHLVEQTFGFFDACADDEAWSADRIALPGGGVRSMVVGLCALRALRCAPTVVSATSGGAWAAVLHYFGTQQHNSVAELCRRIKTTPSSPLPPLIEIYGDVVHMSYDWQALVTAMFGGVCADAPTRADTPSALLIASCLLIDDP